MCTHVLTNRSVLLNCYAREILMSKEKIFAIAEIQMKNGGYDALSFRKIAEELKITKGNVHHHFHTKEELAIAVANYYTQVYFSRISGFWKLHSPDYVAFLKAIEDMFWEEVEKMNSCKVCVVSQVARQDNVPQRLLDVARNHYQQFHANFRKFGQISIDAGMIRDGLDAETLAVQTMMLVNGMTAAAQRFSSPEEARQVLQNQFSNLAKGFGR